MGGYSKNFVAKAIFAIERVDRASRAVVVGCSGTKEPVQITAP